MSRDQYPENIYFSPCFAIKRFMGLREKYGFNIARNKSEYKPEREMWVTGVFLSGLCQITNKKYWLRPNNIDSSPDIFVVSFSGVIAEIQEIEVFEYEKHSKTDLVAAINNKLLNKAYPENYLLLCYVHDRQGEEFKIKALFEEIKAYNPKVSQIWILTSIMSSNQSDHVLVQVYPNLIKQEFNYLKLCQETRQIEMLQAKRELTKKIEKIEFQPLGTYILKLP